MYCHQDHSTYPPPPQQSEFPTVEAAPKFGGKSISTHMISPAPSALSSYPNAIGGPPSSMSTKEMSAATAADQLFAASNPPCPMSGAGCDIGAATATGWVSPSGHESTADSIFVVSSTHPSAGATIPGSDSLFATTGSAKSRKRPAHVMETAHSIPVLPVSPKRPPPSWFNMPPADVSRGLHLQPEPFSQANASPSTFKAPPWIPSTRLTPAATLKSESRDVHQAPSWDGDPPQPHQFVSPSACHAKSPPTSQSPTSTSEGLKLSMNQQPPPSQGAAAEAQLPTNERLPPSSNGARAPTSDASASSPWWSLTNAANEVNSSIWETQQARPTLPPAMMPPSSDRLSKMSVPRLDPFGTIRGVSGTAPLRLPGLPNEAQSDRGFEFMLSTAHQTSQLPPLRPPRAPHQGPFPADGVDDRCEVCWDNEETAVNPIIQCKGCGVKVHQQCYGVCRNDSSSEASEWFCALCLYWRTLGVTTHWKSSENGETTTGAAEERQPPLLYCVLCNRPKGAMKTGSEGRWVHVSCVLYSQDGPTFRDVATRSNPINIDKHLVTHNRNRYSCSICRSTEGYTTNCSFPGCLKRVHVACVFANGYRPKLQTITADVPLYPTAFLCQLPGSPPAEPTETRVVEKLVKIITCETHASENAYNAVELYEKKLLKKTDLSVTAPQAPPDSLLPPPLHPSFLPQATGDTTCRPPSGQTVPNPDAPAGVSAAQTASILTPHSAAAVAPNRLAPQAAPTQQNMWPAAAAQPMYQQYPPPTSSYRLPNGMFMPSAGYPLAAGSAASPYYMHPWHVTPYGGYHAYRGGYGPQYGNIYPDARTGQPGAYPSPYWPSAAYGSLLNRHHTGFSRVNGGGPRGACGINKSRTLMNRGEDTKTTPTASMLPRKKDMSEARPISGMAPSPSNRRVKASSLRTKAEAPASSTSKVTKPAQSASLGPKQRKAEIGSPRTLDEEGTRKSSVKSQRKKGSARASSTTSGALASTTQRKESKNRGSVSRRKAEDDDDLGTATGHVIGAALSTRGFRINWAKIDPHFRSLRQVSDDNLLSSRICEKTDQSLPIKSWSWILDDTTDASVDGAFDDHLAESTLNDLRSIWLDNCFHAPERGPEAPLTVVVSAKVPKTTAEPQTKVCEGAWTFWSMQEEVAKDSGTTTPGGSDGMTDDVMEAAEEEGQRTPTRQANICEDISSCHLTLSPSPYTKMRRREASSSSSTSDKKRVHLHLMQSYALTAKHIACLRQRQSVSRRDLFTLSTRRSSTGESMSDGTENSKMDTSLLNTSRVKACKSELAGPATTDFAKVVERVSSGHDDPTGSKQESARSLIEQPKRKVTVEMANWNEIQRIESHLVKRFPVPPFFILLKKLPQDIGRSAASGGPANTQSTTVQKFLAHRDSVSYTLDPAAPRRVVTASKKLYLHGRIWDLNPSFPLCETLFRSRLPEGSINVSLPSFRDQLQNFLSNPNQPPPIPIPDETTREWLASAQKVRLAASSQAESQLLTEYDRQTAAHGEDLIKILISESYWKRLMFVDDFVRRQALFSFMVWAKKHNRLNTLKDKVSQVMKREAQQCPRIADSDSSTEALKRQSDDASRWSAFRGSILAGHQDPGSALVTRVEAEHTGPSSGESADGSGNTTGTASKIYFCLVCFGTELDNLNPLVTCARCGIKVHKNCYAIGQPAQLDLDILEWYCDRCETEKKTSAEFRSGTCRCALCLRYGGALRRFQGQSYIHITCAVWSSPLLVCGNLYKLSNWRFSNSHNVSSIAQSRVCIFCVRVQEQQSSRRRATRRRQPRDKVVRVSEDEDDALQAPSQTYHGGNNIDPFEDTPSPELPLGTRGLPVKCAHEGCNECFHPLCAWLRGLRVIALENYLRSVASAPTDPFLPGVDISAYCETHTPLYSPEHRLPLDVISSHRIRAYLTREEEPHFSPPVTLSTGEEVAVPPTTPSDTLDGVQGASHSPRLPPLDHAVPEHSSGGSRRPSVNQDLLQGLLASVTDNSQDGASTVQDDVLAGKDVYSENVCQSCLAPLNSSPEASIKCPECAVRVHTECSAGIFSAPDSVKRKTLHHLCTSCRLGGLAHCALCPRLGGGLCEVPRAVISLLLGGKLNSSKSSLTAHKICLMGNVKPEHVNEVKQALALPGCETPSEDDWRQWIIIPQPDESREEGKCTVCGLSSGCLTSCSEAGCPTMMHFSCAGIAGLIRPSTYRCKAVPTKEEEEEPVVKKRRLVETERYECLCLKHVTAMYLEEEGVNDAVLREHKRIHDLQHKLRAIAKTAEAVRDRQRKQRELFEQYADNMVGFGLTRLDASYGISYDHTSKITQFLGQFSGQTLVAADEPNAKRATSSSATEAAPDSGSITEGGYLGDALEGGATESPAAVAMEELTSDIGVPSANRAPSTSEAVDAEAAPGSPPVAAPQPPTTTGMKHTASEVEHARDTLRHTRRRSVDANIDDFPSQQRRVSIAPVDVEKVQDEAVVDVSAIRRHLDAGAADVNHQLVSKESISQTTTASSTSDTGGRRKRKRTIVDAESDDEDDEDMVGGGISQIGTSCTPTPQVAGDSRSKSPKVDFNSDRKRTAPPKHPSHPAPPSYRPRSKVPSAAGRNSPYPTQPKRRRVASLPLRNERGQFVRKANQ